MRRRCGQQRMAAMPRAARTPFPARRLPLSLLTGGAIVLAVAVARRVRAKTRARRLDAKAAEDRHIGFHWLQWEARLARERDAEAAFRAVAAAFGARVGRDESEHLASHLPLGLRAVWDEETANVGRPESFGREELLARVQSRLGLERPEEAEVLVVAVLAWLKHLASEESGDVAALLPADLLELWQHAKLPLVPPWRRLELPVPARRRSLPVRFILWRPGLAEPVAESDGEVFEIPVEGLRFWHGRFPCRVERVEVDRKRRIHLVYDRERDERFSTGLPEGWTLSVDQSGLENLWRAEVLEPDGSVAGWAEDDDCDAAAEEAWAAALLAVGTGYHPEREVE